jgi:L-iditol 2-dehydrogenase
VGRSDLHVADGLHSTPPKLILGHEFAGTVEAVGAGVEGLKPGDRVAALPVVPCLECETCLVGDAANCLRRAMLGMDRDGAFAEFVRVPWTCVRSLPAGLSFAAGAYAEPVAAALGVNNAGLHPLHHGVILGRNRYALLVERLLVCEGFAHLTRIDPDDAESLPANGFDFAIETGLSTETFQEMARLVRPRGTLVLKSRQPGRVGVDVSALVRKQLTLKAVQYGSFTMALGLLGKGRLNLDGLLGPTFPLSAFAEVFERAREDDMTKLFFQPTA